jgi:hypothetical protein
VGVIGRIIKQEIDKFVNLVVEIRKGFNIPAFLYNTSGDDSVPCKEDRVVVLKVDGTGNYVVLGVLNKSQKAKPGEKILFARDADGEIVSTISMLNDGSLNIETKGDINQKSEGKMNVKIKGDITVETAGALNRKTGGDYSLESGGKVTIKATEIELSGDTNIILKTAGSSAWFPNCIPNCPFGIPHGGVAGGISGLKGA